jgi:hypothetical protein
LNDDVLNDDVLNDDVLNDDVLNDDVLKHLWLFISHLTKILISFSIIIIQFQIIHFI